MEQQKGEGLTYDGEGAGVEEEKLLGGAVTVLDFDLLCSTVAMQTNKGSWGSKLRDNDGDIEGRVVGDGEYSGVLRMWEGGLLLDCFDDRLIALQSTCCPCYRFGKNMKRAGFGSCIVQGIAYFALVMAALLNMMAFLVTSRRCFMYLGVAFPFLIGAYLGFFRTRIRKKFNIRGSHSSMDDCAYHVICPCCTLSQESRTLEMNNVQDGIWHGRGDTICVRGLAEGSKNFVEMIPPQVAVAEVS